LGPESGVFIPKLIKRYNDIGKITIMDSKIMKRAEGSQREPFKVKKIPQSGDVVCL
jgi:hypothetical protein